MATSISFAELETFAGEVLPERAVMSTVVTPIVAPDAAPYGGGGDSEGSNVVSPANCSNQQSNTPQGLLFGLVLGGSQQSQAQCTSNTVSSTF